MSSSALSIVPPPEPRIEALPGAETLRPARVLTGWMRPDDAYRLLNSGMNGPTPAPIIETVQRARQAVAARGGGIDQARLVTGVPAELDDHVRALQASPAAAPMHAEGWQVALVNLSRVCAFQPAVLSDQALDRVQLVNENDLASIAAVTLPLTQGDPLPVQYDPLRQAWIIVSDNQNLRIVGNVGPMPVNHCGTGLGFGVIAGPSFMQVGRYKGRHYLRDGYHRAFGLLSRGITVVPAFVRDITAFEELMKDPRTMLPQDSYSGKQPPVLPDYLDSAVSTAVQVPATRKMIIIQALELTPVG
jgi:hypothetical protein